MLRNEELCLLFTLLTQYVLCNLPKEAWDGDGCKRDSPLKVGKALMYSSKEPNLKQSNHNAKEQ